MNRRETNQAGRITSELQEIKAGRRVALEFPVFTSTVRCEYVSVVVLDSSRIAGENLSECSCAALLVPRRRETEWVYSSEGGQWQLLASAGVSRLIVLFPQSDPVKQVGFQNSVDKSGATVREDEELTTILRPLVLALAPKILFCRGIPDIPFVNYADNVSRRLEIEVAYSPLTGLIKVEDVELAPESVHEEQPCLSPQFPGRELNLESSELESPSTKTRKIWIRRLIFHRMPNLIQTAVPLITFPSQDLEHYRRSSDRGSRREKGSSSRRRKSSQEAQTAVKRAVDHSRLVHKYLPPIVAGLVLIGPCLDELSHSQHKAKILCIGVGGGALPIFLHNEFGFRIQVVDLDEVVLDLARRHFGLKEGPNFEVIVGDGLETVTMIARRAKNFGLDNEFRRNWRNSSSDKKPHANLCLLDSTTEVAPTQETTDASEQNLSQTTRLLSSPEDGKSVCERVTASGCASESKFTVIGSRDGISAGDTTISGCSKLDMVSQSTSAQQGEMDPRVEMIVVDVDACDARSELSSPPLAFLERKFLMSARIAVKEGGMLVMNVISSGEKAYSEVIGALLAIFEHVYEIPLENGAHHHHAVFALPNPSCYLTLVGPTVDLVHRVVDGRLIQQIRKLKQKSAHLTANFAP